MSQWDALVRRPPAPELTICTVILVPGLPWAPPRAAWRDALRSGQRARFTAVAAVVAALAGSAAAAALDRTGPPSSPARCRSLSPSARSSPLRYPAAVPAGCCWPRPPPWGRRGAHESRCPWRGDGPWLSTRRRVPGRHQAGPASGGNAGRRRFGEVPTTAPAAGPSTTGPSRAPGAWTGPARDGAGSRCRYRRSQRRLSRWCSPPPPAARCS